jgi:hypothetical protein
VIGRPSLVLSFAAEQSHLTPVVVGVDEREQLAHPRRLVPSGGKLPSQLISETCRQNLVEHPPFPIARRRA